MSGLADIKTGNPTSLSLRVYNKHRNEGVEAGDANPPHTMSNAAWDE